MAQMFQPESVPNRHPGAYVFDLPRQMDVDVAIRGVGWEEAYDGYHMNGLRRMKDSGHYLFQFTVSGYGHLEYDGRTVVLAPGTAFLVAFPSAHRYYLPADSPGWEHVWIQLCGPGIMRAWRRVTRQRVAVASFQIEQPPVTNVMHIYQQARRGEIRDLFALSGLAYQFLMDLNRHLSDPPALKYWPENIAQAILYIRANYDRTVTLDELAEVAQYSKYHFCRLFQQVTGLSPGDYVRNVRIESAKDLLLQTDMLVKNVGRRVGYTSGSYFSKVFKQTTGLSPSAFRRRHQPADGGRQS